MENNKSFEEGFQQLPENSENVPTIRPPSYESVVQCSGTTAISKKNCDSEKIEPQHDQPLVCQQPITTTTTTVIYSHPNHLIVTKPHFHDNLIISIVSLFFCLFIGVPALVYSLCARSARDNGDMDGARVKARIAKQFAISAIIVGIVIIALFIILTHI